MALSYLNKITTFNGGDTFNGPTGIDTDGTNIYVLDAGNKRVVIFDMSLNYVAQFTDSSLTSAAVYDLKDIVAEGNYIDIADRRGYIRRFNNSSGYAAQTIYVPFQAKEFGLTANGGYFYSVGGQDASFLKKVAMSGGATVDNTSATLSTSLPSYQYANGIDIRDNIIYWSGIDTIYLSSLSNINTELNSITTSYGGSGFVGLTTDENNIYVTHATNKLIYIFDRSTLSSLGSFGSTGSGDGQFNKPYGIAYYNNRLYIIDQTNNNVQVLSTLPPSLLDTFIGTSVSLENHTPDVGSKWVLDTDNGGSAIVNNNTLTTTGDNYYSTVMELSGTGQYFEFTITSSIGTDNQLWFALPTSYINDNWIGIHFNEMTITSIDFINETYTPNTPINVNINDIIKIGISQTGVQFIYINGSLIYRILTPYPFYPNTNVGTTFIFEPVGDFVFSKFEVKSEVGLTYLLKDTFYEGESHTYLTSHLADTGQTWTKLSSYADAYTQYDASVGYYLFFPSNEGNQNIKYSAPVSFQYSEQHIAFDIKYFIGSSFSLFLRNNGSNFLQCNFINNINSSFGVEFLDNGGSLGYATLIKVGSWSTPRKVHFLVTNDNYAKCYYDNNLILTSTRATTSTQVGDKIIIDYSANLDDIWMSNLVVWDVYNPPSTTFIKDINSLLYGNMKNVNSILISSMKNFNGLE